MLAKVKSGVELRKKMGDKEDVGVILESELLESRKIYLMSYKVLDDNVISQGQLLTNGTASINLQQLQCQNYQQCDIEITKRESQLHELFQISHILQSCDLEHSKHSANYLQFFHSIRLTETLLTEHLSSITMKLQMWLELQAADLQQSHLKSVLACLEETIESVDYWKFKVHKLNFDALSIVPCHLRLVGSLSKPMWCSTLDDYTVLHQRTHIVIPRNASIKLIDTSSNQLWVIDYHGTQLSVPPSIVFIPPPCSDAISSTRQLKLMFFNYLTQLFKLACKVIFWMVILCVKRSDRNQLKIYLSQMPKDSKVQLDQLINKFSSLFGWCWDEHAGYKLALGRFTTIEEVVETVADGSTFDKKGKVQVSDNEVGLLFQNLAYFLQIFNFVDRLYDIWRVVGIEEEILKSRHHLLVFNKLCELTEISEEEIVKLWKLSINEDMSQEQWVDPYIVVENTTLTTDSESLRRSSRVEQAEFSITGVFDFVKNDYVSVSEAVQQRLMDPEMTRFVNNRTWQRLSMHEALMQQLIRVEATSEKKVVREEAKSYGVITIRTTKDQRPYVIREVWHHKEKKWVNTKSAVEGRILDTVRGFYYGEKPLLIMDAVAAGFVKVEYFEEVENGSTSEEIVQSFTVVGVVNRAQKSIISFDEAVELNILDPDTGTYLDNIKNEHMPASEAIKKTFLKVTAIKDPSKLDYDPENRNSRKNIQKMRAVIMTAAQLKNIASKSDK